MTKGVSDLPALIFSIAEIIESKIRPQQAHNICSNHLIGHNKNPLLVSDDEIDDEEPDKVAMKNKNLNHIMLKPKSKKAKPEKTDGMYS